ncbi:hypothetical protein JD844_026909 [Phrynosoma platyrhinos]|uniref:Uncharacterized protein n=1 Tax=Phrynosoma platyrhinos TaxID=52577 RepID=A0ABQ7SFE9_PHRPL|nr:hypothetical protein JD844_026909 [Phrynosoma platyrhinos]
MKSKSQALKGPSKAGGAPAARSSEQQEHHQKWLDSEAAGVRASIVAVVGVENTVMDLEGGGEGVVVEGEGVDAMVAREGEEARDITKPFQFSILCP